MESVHQTRRQLDILLVDDDEQEISAIALALQQSSDPVHLRVVRSGEEALAYLHPQTGRKPRLLPKLILIEVDHVDCHGFEVLNDVKTHHDLSSIPVVLLTNEDHGVLPSYYSGTCSVVPKPVNQRKLLGVLQSATRN